MAKEAIEAYLEVMHEDGLPIPAVERFRLQGRPGRRLTQTDLE